jgi:hypothetical protein
MEHTCDRQRPESTGFRSLCLRLAIPDERAVAVPPMPAREVEATEHFPPPQAAPDQTARANADV